MPLTPELLKKIDREITGGLPNEFKRIGPCERALDFYHGRFAKYPVRAEWMDKYSKLAPRYSLITQRVVNVLTGNLYRKGPRRSMPKHSEASEWLEGVYRINCVDAAFQQADRLAAVTDAAMFQVVPTSDPKRPIRILLWDASQFMVWLDPDDQLTPVAVAVRDMYDQQSRLTLWTDTEVTTYMTPPVETADPRNKARDFTFRTRKANVLGCLPFAFVHWDFSLQDFWTFGVGGFLSHVNEIVNAALTLTNGSMTYNLVPIILTKNLSVGDRPPSPITPGDVWHLVANPNSEGGGPDPDASYLQADSSFVAASWEDIRSYLDHTLEMCGVPPGTIRMDVDSMRSGVAIIAEQIPLVTWAESRQRPFSYYEDALARVVLGIGARHELVDDALGLQLQKALDEFAFQLRWPPMYPRIPGAEQDTSDAWELQHRQTSPTLLMMERGGYTRDEAESREKEIAGDFERWEALFGEAEPATPGGPGKPDESPPPKPEPDDDDEPEPKPKPKPAAEPDADE